MSKREREKERQEQRRKRKGEGNREKTKEKRMFRLANYRIMKETQCISQHVII